ncbi:glycosyltransferase family 2 protein [Mycetocola spongiae]|uniref:glycosyltransferase family 2 protein n=1 Tax=Mycetocola spongiae TaxID=2859226 RepID=UPI001CF487B3|nr:glycosyltransferase family 2 protein [Mycetocola spongiae]UCR90344.1 glycosyltransferase family 2 protein [Mycetocola spongiae]
MSAITVTYNSQALIGTFLESTIQAGIPASSILVVENASPESSATRSEAERLGVGFIALPENLGYGAAMNRGASALSMKDGYLLLSNPDVVLEPLAVKLMADWLDTHPQTGAVGPQILDETGTVYPSARLIPSLRNGIGHALFAGVWPKNPWSKRYRADAQYTETPRQAGWLSGACLLVRRSAFEQLSGFDEEYFMYFEDVDLGYRLGLAGWSNDYLPAARATHIGGESTRTNASQMLRIHHESAYRFVSKKYSRWWQFPLRLVIRVGLRTRFALSQIRTGAK